MFNIVEPILQPIYNRIDKILKVFEDMAESINDIAQFLYIKDEKEVIRESLDEKSVILGNQSKIQTQKRRSLDIIASDSRPKETKTLTSTSKKIFDYSIKHETDKAYLIRNNKTDLVAWIPKKAVKHMDELSITLLDW